MQATINGFPTTPLSPHADPMDLSGTTELGVLATDSIQRHALGRLYQTWDGRKFRYAKAGGTALVQAYMCQQAVQTSKHIGQVQTAYGAAVGAKDAIRVLVTTGGIAATESWTYENAMTGGFLVCHSVSPAILGDTYMIVKSKMVSETLIDIWLDTPIRNAIAAAGYVTLFPNKYFKTIVAIATTLTGRAVGVPRVPVPANYFYWSQTKGPCPMVVDNGDTITIGAKVGVPASNGAAGTCGAATATLYAFPIYGTCLQVSAGDAVALIDLELE